MSEEVTFRVIAGEAIAPGTVLENECGGETITVTHVEGQSEGYIDPFSDEEPPIVHGVLSRPGEVK